MHDVPINIGQPKISPLVSVRQTLVIYPEQVQNRGIQIVDVHGSWGPRFLRGLG